MPLTKGHTAQRPLVCFLLKISSHLNKAFILQGSLQGTESSVVSTFHFSVVVYRITVPLVLRMIHRRIQLEQLMRALMLISVYQY